MKTKLVIALIATLFVSVLYLLYLNITKKPEIVYVQQTGNIILPTAIPTEIPHTTANKNWKDESLKQGFILNNLPLGWEGSIVNFNDGNPVSFHFGPKNEIDTWVQNLNDGWAGSACVGPISIEVTPNKPTYLTNDSFTKINARVMSVDNTTATQYKVTWLQDSEGIQKGDISYTTVVQSNSKYYIISECNNLSRIKYQNEYDHILSTFKFTESKENQLSWVTINYPKYNLIFNIPKDWYFSNDAMNMTFRRINIDTTINEYGNLIYLSDKPSSETLLTIGLDPDKPNTYQIYKTGENTNFDSIVSSIKFQ